MSIAYLDPGNIESDLQSGATARYKVELLCLRYSPNMPCSRKNTLTICRILRLCLNAQFVKFRFGRA